MDRLEALQWKIGEFITNYDSDTVTRRFAMMELENMYLRVLLGKYTKANSRYKEAAEQAGYASSVAEAIVTDLELADELEREWQFHVTAVEGADYFAEEESEPDDNQPTT